MWLSISQHSQRISLAPENEQARGKNSTLKPRHLLRLSRQFLHSTVWIDRVPFLFVASVFAAFCCLSVRTVSIVSEALSFSSCFHKYLILNVIVFFIWKNKIKNVFSIISTWKILEIILYIIIYKNVSSYVLDFWLNKISKLLLNALQRDKIHPTEKWITVLLILRIKIWCQS